MVEHTQQQIVGAIMSAVELIDTEEIKLSLVCVCVCVFREKE